MSGYELPSDLEYEREWVGNLTFKQIVIGSFFVMFAGLALALPTSLTIKGTIASAIMVVGAAFTVKEMDQDLMDIMAYASRWNVAGYLDDTAYGFIDVKDIKDQVIVKSGVKKTAIIRVDPINFEVKSEEKRKSILANYRKFLQSIEFPIDIVVRTVDSMEKVDEYFDYNRKKVKEFAEENEKPELKSLFRNQKEFYIDYIQENEVKNKLFYIVIEVDEHEFEKAKDELDMRCEEVQSMLGDCGLKTERLNTNQLYSLMASYFQDAVEVDQDYEFPFTLLRKEDLDKYNLERQG